MHHLHVAGKGEPELRLRPHCVTHRRAGVCQGQCDTEKGTSACRVCVFYQYVPGYPTVACVADRWLIGGQVCQAPSSP